MPPRKYTMDEPDKKNDEKFLIHLNVIRFLIWRMKLWRNLKDKNIEVLKSQITLLQNHVRTGKHALDENVEEFEQYGRRVCIRIEGVERKFWKKWSILLRSMKLKLPNQFLIELIALDQYIPAMIREKRCKAWLSDLQHLDIALYFIQIAKILNLVPELD